MYYHRIPREMIYKDRERLEEFTDKNELLSTIVDNMEDLDVFTEVGFDSQALLCLNTAYYICTLIMLDKKPSRRYNEYKDMAYAIQENGREFQLATLSLVYILLRHCGEQWQQQNEKLLNKIEKFITINIEPRIFTYDVFNESTEEFVKLDFIYKKLSYGTNQNITFDNEFKPRPITYKLLADNYSVEELKELFGTDEDKVLDFIYSLGKDEEEQHIIVSFMEDRMHSFFTDGWQHRAFFNSIKSEIHKKFHYEEESAEIEAQIEEDLMKDYEQQWELDYYKDEYQKQKDEIAKLRAEIEKIKEAVKDVDERHSITQEQFDEIFSDLDSPSKEENGSMAQQLSQQKTDEQTSELQETIRQQQATIDEQAKKIAELEEQIDFFQKKQKAMTRRKNQRAGLPVGLTKDQVAVFGKFLSDELHFDFDGFKGGKGLGFGMFSQFIWGYSAEKIRQAAPQREDKQYVASIFGPFSPDLAKKICDTWTEKVLPPWEKENNSSISP